MRCLLQSRLFADPMAMKWTAIALLFTAAQQLYPAGTARPVPQPSSAIAGVHRLFVHLQGSKHECKQAFMRMGVKVCPAA